jgi:protein-L-isoaspartate(D-aspartate) O-methyltransferase
VIDRRFWPCVLVVLVGCEGCGAPPTAVEFADERARMVAQLEHGYRVRDRQVLAAMLAVPRHEFVPAARRALAYADHPLPIGHAQTISQPYIVAFMTEHLGVRPGDKVLEIGTGSGYQAAVLAALGARVFSIEIVEPLGRQADELLRRLGYEVAVRIGDGYRGWPDEAPFDAIIVTAAPDHVPQPLIDQLAVGGRMIVPVGRGSQDLVLLTRTATGVERRVVLPVRFVPMTGEAEERR